MHGLLFGAGFAPFSIWPLEIVSAGPLIFAAARTHRPARTAVGAACGIAPMWAFHHQYTWSMTEAAFVPLAFYLAAFGGLFVWALARVRWRWPSAPLALVAPMLWTAIEMLRGEIVFDGYAQYMIAHPLIDRVVALAAPIVGVYPVGFVVVALAGAMVDSYLKRRSDASASQRRTWPGIASLAWMAVAFVCCVWPRPHATIGNTGPSVVLAAVQTNIPQDNRASRGIDERRADFNEMGGLTRLAASAAPAMIAWPEAMVPALALNSEAVAIEREARLAYPGGVSTTIFYDGLLALQDEVAIPLLVGGQAVEGLTISAKSDGGIEIDQAALFNSAFMVRAGEVEASRYDKMQLMPFGEVMPYISNWDWLEQRLLAIGGRGLTFDLAPGATARVFELSPASGADPVRIAAPICFESVFARQMRRLVNHDGRRAADIFVNISNDGWFAWYDAGRENLVLQCRWRCLELSTPMLRSVNTGISAAIDHQGFVMRRGPTMPSGSAVARSSGVLTAEFDVSARELTIYSRVGDVAAWAVFAAALVLLVMSVVPKRASVQKSEDSKP